MASKASMIWDEKFIASIAIAQRPLIFEIVSVIEIDQSGSIYGYLLEYSPLNSS